MDNTDLEINSTEFDLRVELENDEDFPTQSKDYHYLYDYLVSRQKEDETYYNGYDTLIDFDFLWELYRQEVS